MEIEEFKNTWKNQDKKLDAMLKTNEKLLKRINYDKIRQEFRTTLDMELANLWAVPLGVFACLYSCYSKNWEGLLVWSFAILLILGIISMVFYTKRYKMLKDVLKFDSSVTDSLKKLYRYEAFFNRYKKYEYMLSPILLVTILYIVIFDENKLGFHPFFIQSFAIGLVVGTILIYFGYRYYYTNKINRTIESLKELEEFESQK